MTSLTQRIESLRLGDGRPDVQARKAELESLMKALTSNEIRHLRPQINAKTFQKDICGSLPVELLLCVSQHLELEDLKRALSVSRRWNEVFSSPDFHLGIVKLHFIQIWETSYRGLDPEQQQIRKRALHNWLPAAALKRIKRLHGRYHSTSENHYDRGLLEVHGSFDRPQYCNGRIAYKVDNGTIMVSSLRTGHTVVFADENRMRFSKWLLADQLIVAQMENPAILLAWPLSTDKSDRPYSVRLPSQSRHISGYRNEVGIITVSNEVLKWRIGGQLKSVVISELKERFPDCEIRSLTVAFHPEDEQCYFVVHIASTNLPNPSTTGGRKITIVVQECTDGVPSVLYHFDIFSSQMGANLNPRVISLEDGSIGIMADNEMLYVPGNTKEHARKPLISPHPYNHHRTNLRPGGSDTIDHLIVIKFNTRKRTFSTRSYHLSNNSPHSTPTTPLHGVELHQVQIWRDQALLPVRRIDDSIQGSALSVDHMVAISINECSATRNRPCEVPWYGTRDASGPPILWNDGSGETRFVRGDDDFVVLFGDEGYIVWCFEEDVVSG